MATVAGCGFAGIRNEITMLDDSQCIASEKPAGDVDMYFGAELPERSFDRIAYIELSAGTRFDTGDLLAAMRTSAAKCGADAVIAVDKKYGVITHDYIFSDDEDVEEQGVLTGVAVVYRQPPARYEAWED